MNNNNNIKHQNLKDKEIVRIVYLIIIIGDTTRHEQTCQLDIQEGDELSSVILDHHFQSTATDIHFNIFTT